MCRDASVKLVYLPPYSPDLNPIEEFFAELKAFIKKQWHEFEESPEVPIRTSKYSLNGVLVLLAAKSVAREDISGTREWM